MRSTIWPARRSLSARLAARAVGVVAVGEVGEVAGRRGHREGVEAIRRGVAAAGVEGGGVLEGPGLVDSGLQDGLGGRAIGGDEDELLAGDEVVGDADEMQGAASSPARSASTQVSGG